MYTIFSRPNSKFSFSNCWKETEGLKSQHQYPQLRSTQIDNFHNIIQVFVLYLYNLQGFFATMIHPLQPPSLFLKVGISLMKEGCLFVLFVMVRSPKPQCLLLHSWYTWKAPNEYGFTELVSQCFNLRWRSYWILNNFSLTIHLNQN
jgi:hypothetical protein